jgi:hypothetical protein
MDQRDRLHFLSDGEASMDHESGGLRDDLASALETERGFAAGKLGFSEQCVLGYAPLLERERDPRRIVAYEAALRFHCERQTGIFPTDPDFLKRFAIAYAEHVRALDVIGLFGGPQEPLLRDWHRLPGRGIPYRLMEPDLSSPDRPERCYLPLLAGKRLLIVAPFARLLASRCVQATFEAAWAKTGKRWFAPAAVAAVEFPYGYVTETDTHARFGDVLRLYEQVCADVAGHEFDVALIAAGALGIPLAAFVKSLGRIGLSLGGHLQVIFGVGGRRWHDDPFYRDHVMNDSWIDLPADYRPRAAATVSDGGAYW